MLNWRLNRSWFVVQHEVLLLTRVGVHNLARREFGGFGA